MNDLSSKNFDSIDQSIGTEQVVTPTVNNNCGGEGVLNYEYQETGKNKYLWKDLWAGSKYKEHLNDKDVAGISEVNGIVPDKMKNHYLKTEQQLKDLLFDQPIIDIIKNGVPLDGNNFEILNSENYYPISKQVEDWYGNLFIHDTYSYFGQIKDKNKAFKNNITNQDEVRSVFDIQVLPSGLRSMIFSIEDKFMIWKEWPQILLVTVGPDELNILTGIGLSYDQAFGQSVNSKIKYKDERHPSKEIEAEFDYIYNKFFEDYDDIINEYNTNKTRFLNTIAKVLKTYRLKQVQTDIETGYHKADSYTVKVWSYEFNTGTDIALFIALKYVDCPNEYEFLGDASLVTPKPSPSPSVAATTTATNPPTLTAKNITDEEEGIYNAEFLPATEDNPYQIYDEEYTANALALAAIAKDPSQLTKFRKPPPSITGPSVQVDWDEIGKWVKTWSRVQKDADEGWINPNHTDWGRITINPYLLQSIASACKATGIVATITTAKTGHNINAKGGKESRHWKGTGVDIAILNGVSGNDKNHAANSISNMVPEFKRLGTILYTQLLADGHGGNVNQLGTDNQAEAPYDKSVLFMTKIGGNHYNHLHVGNRILSAPGVTPKVIRQ
jgi:hypothetical protein